MKSVLVTGGSGSFGQAFIKHILNDHGIERIAVYSRGEHLQEEMARKIKDDRLRFFIGDVRDRDRLEMAMNGVDSVVHAAALKVVPIAEYNPTECIATNVGGAENVVKAALRAGVKRVVALSTDKAVNPINLYGASKLAAEKVFVAANALGAGRCHFNVVRYGNVAGSRGSVLPLFKMLKAEGRALTITDARMTRFWITLDQSVQLVVNALGISDRGFHSKILVPIIPSIKIVDLAKAIDPETPFRVSGVRPGEKIHETLITEDEGRATTIQVGLDGKNFYVINEQGYIPRHHEPLAGPMPYTSDGNLQWLSLADLKTMVA